MDLKQIWLPGCHYVLPMPACLFSKMTTKGRCAAAWRSLMMTPDRCFFFKFNRFIDIIVAGEAKDSQSVHQRGLMYRFLSSFF
jgi:hypothetical protein